MICTQIYKNSEQIFRYSFEKFNYYIENLVITSKKTCNSIQLVVFY